MVEAYNCTGHVEMGDWQLREIKWKGSAVRKSFPGGNKRQFLTDLSLKF